MTDQELELTLEAARRAGPTWNAGRQQQTKWAVMARLDHPRRRRPLFVLALGCVAASAIAVVGGLRSGLFTAEAPPPFRATPVAAQAVASPLSKLADGSSIVLDGPAAILKKTVETSDEVAFQLEAGGAHFEVAPRPSRIFRVHAGPVTVQVIGTRFHVQRQDARSRITVDRGKVLVSWWGGSRELVAGEEGMFPPAYESPSLSPPARASTASSPPLPSRSSAGKSIGSSRSTASSWSSPSSKVVTAASSPSGVVESAAKPMVANTTSMQERYGAALGPEATFARADRARSEGKADLAIAHLREIVDRYPGDAHAPMAAFTVGRLLLESMGKPRQAALAFAQARALANGGPLGEDALAREVEALHAAGDSSAARQRADLYRQIFPNGPRLHTVMRFGGLRATP